MFKQTLSALALAFACSPVMAIDYMVTRSDDPDPNPNILSLSPCTPARGCSLRQAILASNNRPGADRIMLRRGTTYTLTRTTPSSVIDGRSGPLWVTDELEIVGNGVDFNRIEWPSNLHHQHSVLVHGLVNGGPTSPPLRLRNLIIANGRGDLGGCLRTHHGTEFGIYGVIVENCQARKGGGIHTDTPLLVIDESVIRNNSATQNGGGIEFSGSATIVASRAAVLNNHANVDGGGFAADGMSSAIGAPTRADLVWRSESGPSDFWDNSAGGNGGAIAVGLHSSLNLFRLSSNTTRATFKRNIAGGKGGAIALNSYTSIALQGSLTVEDALLIDNDAVQGGAIATTGGKSLIVSSEFQENRALAGSGGALYFESTDTSTRNEIRKSSFNSNFASVRGGAIASVCQPLSVRDSSLWANWGPSGQAIQAAGQTSLTHVTTANHGSQALVKDYHTACGNRSFSIANSLIAFLDRCAVVSGSMSSGGGNFYSGGATGCNFIAGLDFLHSPSAFGLLANTYGGEQMVLGWDNDGQARPQVNGGNASYCSSEDVRGFPRNDGACDAGAFEQQLP